MTTNLLTISSESAAELGSRLLDFQPELSGGFQQRVWPLLDVQARLRRALAAEAAADRDIASAGRRRSA